MRWFRFVEKAKRGGFASDSRHVWLFTPGVMENELLRFLQTHTPFPDVPVDSRLGWLGVCGCLLACQVSTGINRLVASCGQGKQLVAIDGGEAQK